MTQHTKDLLYSFCLAFLWHAILTSILAIGELMVGGIDFSWFIWFSWWVCLTLSCCALHNETNNLN